MQQLENSLVSVVIPVPADPQRVHETTEKVSNQNWGDIEIILVSGPETGISLPQGPLIQIAEDNECQNMAHLINTGMRVAQGDIRVLLMPNCVPAGPNWLPDLVAPFAAPDVSAVVCQCDAHQTRDANLPARLMESVESPVVKNDQASGSTGTQLLSHLCDAFRADLIRDSEDFYRTYYATPGEGVDLSIRLMSESRNIVLSPSAKVLYLDPPKTRSMSTVLQNALNYGFTDALLGKIHNVDWLGSRIYTAAVLSLFAVPIALIHLPIAIIFTLLLFAWCWFLPLRTPVLSWEVPISILHVAIYAAIVLSIRGHWAPSIFPPRQWHPAIIRQLCFVGALPTTFALILFYDATLSASRAAKDMHGILYAPGVFFFSIVWNVLAGIGYMRGYFTTLPPQD